MLPQPLPLCQAAIKGPWLWITKAALPHLSGPRCYWHSRTSKTFLTSRIPSAQVLIHTGKHRPNPTGKKDTQTGDESTVYIYIYIYIYIIYINITFTFSHLADTFIQREIQIHTHARTHARTHTHTHTHSQHLGLFIIIAVQCCCSIAQKVP